MRTVVFSYPPKTHLKLKGGSIETSLCSKEKKRLLKNAGKGTPMCEPVMRVVVGTGKHAQTFKKCPVHKTKLKGETGCPDCGLKGIRSLARSLRESYTVKAPRRARRLLSTVS